MRTPRCAPSRIATRVVSCAARSRMIAGINDLESAPAELALGVFLDVGSCVHMRGPEPEAVYRRLARALAVDHLRMPWAVCARSRRAHAASTRTGHAGAACERQRACASRRRLSDR